MRIAGAPISWGVCEVPGWGYQLDRDRVLTQMRTVGLTATEFGPDGFLPGDPQALAAELADAGLGAVGGFVPVVLHDGHDVTAEIDAVLDRFLACGADVLVLAAATGSDGYDDRPALDPAGWDVLLGTLDAVAEQAARRGVLATLHPHVGTMVEREDEVQRVLDGSSVALCLDTGHLAIGGTDPVALAARVPDRIRHVHLKDVDAALAARVRGGQLGYADAVASGMYRPLGEGDVDIAAIVDSLRGNGYDGWFVLEQDTVLHGEPEGEGPLADVRTCVEFLRGL